MEDLGFWIALGGLYGAYLWLGWYYGFLADKLSAIRANVGRWVMPLIPLVCLAVVGFVLTTWGASDVRSDTGQILIYLSIGIGWLRIVEWLFRYLGLNTVDDVLARRNNAALIALAGAFLGATFCYCGSNIGEGPGAEVVVFCSLLSGVIFFVLWWLLDVFAQSDLRITVNRDVSAGLRLGGYLAASGLILGRAVAGNWISIEATLIDFVRYGFPVLVLFAAALLVEFITTPTIEHPEPSPILYGVIPLVFYVGAAVIYLSIGKFPA